MLSMVLLSMSKRRSAKARFNTFLSGMCIKHSTGYYYVNGGRLFELPTERIVASWGFPRITEVYALPNLPVGGKMGFRSGTIVMDYTTYAKYYIEGNKRRRITDPDFCLALGVKTPMIASRKEIDLHEPGEDI